MPLFPSHQIQFVTSAPSLGKLPQHAGVEIAVVGRSNSGKSTFINQLCGRKIAYTSSRPGKTQLLNLFQLHPQRPYYLLDLPGYGFAKASKTTQAQWQQTIRDYLLKRKHLKALCITIDSRRLIGPLDEPILQWCQANHIHAHVVLTKVDKLNQAKTHQALQTTQTQLEQMGGDFSLQKSSSIKKIGIDAGQETITKLFESFQDDSLT